MSTVENHHAIIIIGAGLSGLYTAWMLHKKNQDFIILEARGRTGGRIPETRFGDNGNSFVDMGPSWVWPEFQPRINNLLTALNLNTFKQFTDGDMLYEHGTDNIERYSNQSAHDMSHRISGGAYSVIQAICTKLPEGSIRLNNPVTSLTNETSNNRKFIGITCQTGETISKYTADKVVLALPPRISQQSIVFKPQLSTDAEQLWQHIPTWMASHCKIVFVYDQPFWRRNSLSGETFSQRGPLSEIYDASPADESVYALTSFVGLNAHQRNKTDQKQLIDACIAQLNRLYGDAATDVKAVHLKDWSVDRYTAAALDLNSQSHHPQYPSDHSNHLWDKRLILAGTETAREHGGYIEGALESADAAIQSLDL